ncbi:MAG: aspartate aminotransferase family protein [Armatimonadota bacterium]|nr:aspartate aminotransferase family protein [Armatimonadota bacterium]MDR7550354.1 aspartate aminotransferase family protein [Armatimonadota bacterium]
MDSAGFAQRVGRLGDLLAPSLAEDWPNLPVVRGEGTWLYGLDGRRYLDFVSGMAACNLGHRHPRVVEAARAQIDRLIHGPIGMVAYDPLLRLCEELGRITPGDLTMFFWGNGGTEAVEGAIKLARYVTRRPAIVDFIGGFHGRSLGSASVTTSNAKYRRHYEPLLPSVYHVPFPYCFRCPHRTGPGCCGDPFVSLERLFRHVVYPEDVAAMIVEPILGEGGYVVPPPDFLPRLGEICTRYGILLIFDEIQTGFGRTGEMFAAQTFGVVPDVLVLSKAIASGFPLSAVAAGPDLMRRWTAGSHGTTFGGNPVACAAALATLEVFREERVLDNARLRSQEAMARLQALVQQSPYIGEVRGRGLMIGVEFVDPAQGHAPAGAIACRVLEGCLHRGLILYPAGWAAHVIRFIPPLTVSRQELEEGLGIFSDVVMGLGT